MQRHTSHLENKNKIFSGWEAEACTPPGVLLVRSSDAKKVCGGFKLSSMSRLIFIVFVADVTPNRWQR